MMLWLLKRTQQFGPMIQQFGAQVGQVSICAKKATRISSINLPNEIGPFQDDFMGRVLRSQSVCGSCQGFGFHCSNTVRDIADLLDATAQERE